MPECFPRVGIKVLTPFTYSLLGDGRASPFLELLLRLLLARLPSDIPWPNARPIPRSFAGLRVVVVRAPFLRLVRCPLRPCQLVRRV